jgi:hypothetical protein
MFFEFFTGALPLHGRRRAKDLKTSVIPVSGEGVKIFAM